MIVNYNESFEDFIASGFYYYWLLGNAALEFLHFSAFLLLNGQKEKTFSVFNLPKIILMVNTHNNSS